MNVGIAGRSSRGWVPPPHGLIIPAGGSSCEPPLGRKDPFSEDTVDSSGPHRESPASPAAVHLYTVGGNWDVSHLGAEASLVPLLPPRRNKG